MICGRCKTLAISSRKILAFPLCTSRKFVTSSTLQCNKDAKKDDNLDDIIETLPPYPKFTPEERKYIYRGIVDASSTFLHDIHTKSEKPGNIDPSKEPYNEIYVDGVDKGNFTAVEVVSDKHPELWFWVERLLKSNVPPRPSKTAAECSSGYVPPPDNPPNLPYFVSRTRNYLYPVYKLVTEDTTLNQLSKPYHGYMEYIHYLMKPKEFETLTVVKRIRGDIWQLEKELKNHLQRKYDTRIRSSVNEYEGKVEFLGDYVKDTVMWLEQKGF